MGFGAAQVLSGATLLSELGIDVSKNWLGYLIKGLADPVDAQDAVTLAYLTSHPGAFLPLAGGTMSGDIAMATHKVTGLDAPSDDNDAARKKYIDDVLATVSVSQPARSLGTIYQNTGGKIRLLVVCASLHNIIQGGVTNEVGIQGLIGAASPPVTQVAEMTSSIKNQTVAGNMSLDELVTITFIVPKDYYYKVQKYETNWGFVNGIVTWTEYDLH